MKRLLALFLICLLPMQVFAGMLAHENSVDPATSAWQQLQAETAAAAHDQQAEEADRDGPLSCMDSEDFFSHAGVGDETASTSALVFLVDSATPILALRSDLARQAPFLPPAGRPPQS